AVAQARLIEDGVGDPARRELDEPLDGRHAVRARRGRALREQRLALLAQGSAAARAHGVPAVERLVEFPAGRVSDAILDEARLSDCDLIVMGTHGRRGFAHMMLGSDAERVVHESRLPVLLVRHPEAPKR
ncbi:MAG: universal stress protein, partial [Pseudomonadota bacterium]